jgi:hypothetical protein
MAELDTPKIYDDLFSQAFMDEVEATLLGDYFGWFYSPDVTWGRDNPNMTDKIGRAAFKHHYYMGGSVNSDYAYIPQKIHAAATKVYPEFASKRIDLARSFLHPQHPEQHRNAPHTDQEAPHYVCLYYVNDVDGNTIIFKGMDDTQVLMEVEPKKGRLVVFDGNSNLHCSTTPTTGARAIVNLNLV